MTLLDHPLIKDISIRADATEFRTATAWLEDSCLEHGVPQDQIARLDICLHETLANILAHGGDNAKVHPVSLCLEITQDDDMRQVSITASDSGFAFDPTTVATSPQAPKNLAETEPGGLGLMMIRSNTDLLSYRRIKDRNQLIFGVRWPMDKG